MNRLAVLAVLDPTPLARVSPILATLAAAGLAAAGCGGGSADAGWQGRVDTLAGGAVHVRNPTVGLRDSARSRLVEELRLGNRAGTGPATFGNITALAVDRAGRIYVGDGQALEIRVFDPDGAFVRAFGGDGEGPGEFRHVSALLWGPEGRLWAVDQRNARFTVFDTAGRYLATRRRRVGGGMYPWPGGFDDRGRMMDVSLSSLETSLIRYDTAFRPADTIPLPEVEQSHYELRTSGGARIRAGVPFTPGLAWTLDPEGDLWFGVTDDYRIVERAPDGDTLRIVERPHEPVPVTEAARDSALERLDWFRRQGGDFDPSRIPDRRPAFRDLHVDRRGRLWVEAVTAGEEEAGPALDIFDPRGRYLVRLRSPVPVDLNRMVVRGDRLYMVSRDELDVPMVVRLAIRRGGPDGK